MTEFQPFPKIARLNRDIVVTEKIDGTNAAVVIVHISNVDHVNLDSGETILFDADKKRAIARIDDYFVFAQSRTRFITPTEDNYRFAAWVKQNASGLVEALGEGIHYGEWWGSGIQRKYGLTGGERMFSLFNAARWGLVDLSAVPGLGTVPVLYEGEYSQQAINLSLELLRSQGSIAAPGFDRPEGIVIYHTASRDMFKVTLEGDESPKGAAAHALDEEKAA